MAVAGGRRKLARLQAGDVGSSWGDGEMMKVDSRSMSHRADGRVPRTRLIFSCLANLFPYPRNAGGGVRAAGTGGGCPAAASFAGSLPAALSVFFEG